MKLIYMSITGNVRSFVERTGMDSIELNPSNIFNEINEDFIIIVPSYVGYINDEVEDFLEYKNNLQHLVGFVGSGNLNFDDLYCINAKELSKKYSKPIIFMFEYSGTQQDIEKFKEEVKLIESTRT